MESDFSTSIIIIIDIHESKKVSWFLHCFVINVMIKCIKIKNLNGKISEMLKVRW